MQRQIASRTGEQRVVLAYVRRSLAFHRALCNDPTMYKSMPREKE